MTTMLSSKPVAAGGKRPLDSHDLFMRQESDESLILAIAGGDDRPMVLLYQRYNHLLYAISYSMVADHHIAEDLVQETFFAVWQRANTYAAQAGSVYTWLSSIVRNRTIDYLRHRAINTVAISPEIEDEESFVLADMWDEVWQSFQSAAVYEAVMKLPQQLRLLIVLAYFQDWSHSYIASTYHIPLGTVKSRLRHAIITLKPLLCNHVDFQESSFQNYDGPKACEY